MEPRTFIITRHNWYRGHHPYSSRLLRPDGMMCCLGHISKQCGVTDEQMLNVSSPGILSGGHYQPIEFMNTLLRPLTPGEWGDGTYEEGLTHTKTAERMMRVNDNNYMTDTQREAELIETAATIGWTLVFQD